MVMQLERYEKAEMEIIEFDVMDIMASGEADSGGAGWEEEDKEPW